MPYVFIDDDSFDAETMGEPAAVVAESDYKELESTTDQLRRDRDDAVEKLSSLESEFRDLKDRYAHTVISGATVNQRAREDTHENGTAQSFSELFANRVKG